MKKKLITISVLTVLIIFFFYFFRPINMIENLEDVKIRSIKYNSAFPNRQSVNYVDLALTEEQKQAVLSTISQYTETRTLQPNESYPLGETQLTIEVQSLENGRCKYILLGNLNFTYRPSGWRHAVSNHDALRMEVLDVLGLE